MASLLDDPLLSGVAQHEGYKVLPPAVLYVKIGQGGMGAVYRGRHLTLDLDVAVKCLKPALAAEDSRYIERFGREARLAAEISHENLVRVYHVDLDERSRLHYLVMEFVEGETARDRVKRKGPLAEAEAAKILLGAARGLARAHRHERAIVHRDVKPENILVSRRGEVKIADLGIAKAEEAAGTLTSSNVAIGTPQYMAPEQWDDAHRVGPAADVWALGATLYFLLSGENAVRSGTMQQICREICDKPFPDVRTRRPELSEELFRILTRCVERDPARRYPDAAPLAEALERYVGGHQTTLLDIESGTVRAEVLVSPPPSQALQRIRARLQLRTGSDEPPRTGPEPARTVAPSPTVSRRSAWPWAAGTLLLALGAFALWRFSGDPAATAAPVPALGSQGAPSSTPDTEGVESEKDLSRSPASEPLVEPLDVPLDERDLAGPVVAAPVPALTLDQDLGRERRIDTNEMTVRLAGRIANADPNGLLRLTRGGKPSGDYSIEPDGRFELELGLKRNQREALELTHGRTTLALEVVQDSEAPVLTLLEPAEAARRTSADAFDLVLRVNEPNLLEVKLGNRLLAQGPDDTWVAAGVGLPKEGENRFTVLARDRAAIEGRLELTLVRDTQGPRLVRAEPADGVEVEAGSSVALTLTFDEAPTSATLSGRAGRLERQVARFELDVPPGEGRFEWKGEARDALGNSAPFSWTGSRRSRPEARVPEGWEVVDATPGFEGWAKKVREPKSGIELILVAPGTFQMGSPVGEEGHEDDETQHRVELTKAFYLGETEVTQAQYERVIGSNPSSFKGPNLPVESVTWDEATSFSRSIGCELPTEVQWEYACRADTTAPFSFGATISTEQVNYNGNTTYGSGKKGAYREKTVDAKSLPRNAWGFYEMHGNVWEWCRDGYREDYQSLSAKDPFHEDAEARVLRGGSWFLIPVYRRSANRFRYGPSARYATSASASRGLFRDPLPSYPLTLFLFNCRGLLSRLRDGRRFPPPVARGSGRKRGARAARRLLEQQPGELPLRQPQQERALRP